MGCRRLRKKYGVELHQDNLSSVFMTVGVAGTLWHLSSSVPPLSSPSVSPLRKVRGVSGSMPILLPVRLGGFESLQHEASEDRSAVCSARHWSWLRVLDDRPLECVVAPSPTLEVTEGRRPTDRSEKGDDSDRGLATRRDRGLNCQSRVRLLKQRHCSVTPRSRGVGTPSGQAR